MNNKVVGGLSSISKQPLATHFPARADSYTVYLAASEFSPFSQTGGLGQAMRGLAEGLTELGHQVYAFIPKHTGSAEAILDRALRAERLSCVEEHSINILGTTHQPVVYQTMLPTQNSGIQIYLIDSSQYEHFGSRPFRGAYGHSGDSSRYYFFNRVVASLVEKDSQAIVHTHEWHTGYAALLLRSKYLNKQLPLVHTIHNLGYGNHSPRHQFFQMSGLSEHDYPGLESQEGINFPPDSDLADPQATVIRVADNLITVSNNYRNETLFAMHGHGYEHLLSIRAGAGQYHGIVNGVDSSWYPKYNINNFVTEKAHYKSRVQKAFNLPQDQDSLLIMMLSRFDSQKGYEIVMPVLERLYEEANLKFQFVVSANSTDGPGNNLIQYLKILQQRYPQNISIKDIYFDKLAHQIYSGADIALSPSLYEPCGLIAPVGILHGTPTVGRATGGMVDIIKHRENGFLFSGDWYLVPGDRNHNKLTEKLYQAILEANQLFQNKTQWQFMLANMMKKGQKDLSWKTVAKQYEDVYQETHTKFQRAGPYKSFPKA